MDGFCVWPPTFEFILTALVKNSISLVLTDDKLDEIASKMRYDNLHSVAIRIMKLPDAQLDGIRNSNEKDHKKNYEILKLWRDTRGLKEDLHTIFCEARKQGIGVEPDAINCLPPSDSGGIILIIL